MEVDEIHVRDPASRAPGHCEPRRRSTVSGVRSCRDKTFRFRRSPARLRCGKGDKRYRARCSSTRLRDSLNRETIRRRK